MPGSGEKKGENMWSNKGQTVHTKKRAYIVDRAEAAMANLAQVGEDLLRIFLIKILRNLGVLQVARPAEGDGDEDGVKKRENEKEEETEKRKIDSPTNAKVNKRTGRRCSLSAVAVCSLPKLPPPNCRFVDS